MCSARHTALSLLAPAAALLLTSGCTAADAEETPTRRAPAAATSPPAGPAADSLLDALVVRADQGRIKGSESAPVWLIVLSDFECGFCRRWHLNTMPRIEREYVATGKVRLAYLNFPLRTHPKARPAHELAMCAAEQDAFWPVADRIFETQDVWRTHAAPASFFASLARELPLDQPRLAACLAGGALRPLIDTDIQRGTRVGVASTPSFFVGTQRMVGAQEFEAFAAVLDRELAAAAAKRAP